MLCVLKAGSACIVIYGYILVNQSLAHSFYLVLLDYGIKSINSNIIKVFGMIPIFLKH